VATITISLEFPQGLPCRNFRAASKLASIDLTEP